MKIRTSGILHVLLRIDFLLIVSRLSIETVINAYTITKLHSGEHSTIHHEKSSRIDIIALLILSLSLFDFDIFRVCDPVEFCDLRPFETSITVVVGVCALCVSSVMFGDFLISFCIVCSHRLFLFVAAAAAAGGKTRKQQQNDQSF